MSFTLVHLDPEELHPNPFNPNRVSAENMERLAESLRRNGWIRPVLARRVNNLYQILGGQHRVEVAKHYKLGPVPVIDLGEIDDKRAKEIGLLDNTRYGEDDALGLAEILGDIGEVEELKSFLPFIDAELSAIDARDINLDTLDLPDEPEEKPKSKAVRSHQVLRFKVPVDDADSVTDYIRSIQNTQGFTGTDSLANAGDALVWLINRIDELENSDNV